MPAPLPLPQTTPTAPTPATTGSIARPGPERIPSESSGAGADGETTESFATLIEGSETAAGPASSPTRTDGAENGGAPPASGDARVFDTRLFPTRVAEPSTPIVIAVPTPASIVNVVAPALIQDVGRIAVPAPVDAGPMASLAPVAAPPTADGTRDATTTPTSTLPVVARPVAVPASPPTATPNPTTASPIALLATATPAAVAAPASPPAATPNPTTASPIALLARATPAAVAAPASPPAATPNPTTASPIALLASATPAAVAAPASPPAATPNPTTASPIALLATATPAAVAAPASPPAATPNPTTASPIALLARATPNPTAASPIALLAGATPNPNVASPTPLVATAPRASGVAPRAIATPNIGLGLSVEPEIATESGGDPAARTRLTIQSAATAPEASARPHVGGVWGMLDGTATVSQIAGASSMRSVALGLATRVGGNPTAAPLTETVTPPPSSAPATTADLAPRPAGLVLASEGGFAVDLEGAGGPAQEATSSDSASRLGAATTRPAAPPPPPTVQVAARITQGVEDGLRRINVRLHPAELGRVDIKLDIGFDGRVLAVITADRIDTLELLQRDARLLEKALQDAGLDTGSGGLSFSLRGESEGREGDGFAGDDPSGRPGRDIETGGAATIAASDARRTATDRLLDINV